jgi:hypothetical protein
LGSTRKRWYPSPYLGFTSRYTVTYKNKNKKLIVCAGVFVGAAKGGYIELMTEFGVPETRISHFANISSVLSTIIAFALGLKVTLKGM